MKRNLTSGSVLKNIIYFSLPYMLSYFLQTLYGMADLFIIGQFDGVAGTTAVLRFFKCKQSLDNSFFTKLIISCSLRSPEKVISSQYLVYAMFFSSQNAPTVSSKSYIMILVTAGEVGAPCGSESL